MIRDTDLSVFAYELHIFAGDFLRECEFNMRSLATNAGADSIAIMGKNHMWLSDALFAYCSTADLHQMILTTEFIGARAFLFHTDLREGGHLYGDVLMMDLDTLRQDKMCIRDSLRYDNGQLGDIEYTIHEQPVSTENTGLSPKRENPRQVKPEQAKPKQAEPEQENPAQLNTNPLKTKKSKKDKSITYPSIYPAEPEAASRTDGMDRIELIEAYREIIKENIEYDLLVLRYGRERLDEALELMLEVILSKRPYIRIAGDDFPREIVKSR